MVFRMHCMDRKDDGVISQPCIVGCCGRAQKTPTTVTGERIYLLGCCCQRQDKTCSVCRCPRTSKFVRTIRICCTKKRRTIVVCVKINIRTGACDHSTRQTSVTTPYVAQIYTNAWQEPFFRLSVSTGLALHPLLCSH